MIDIADQLSATYREVRAASAAGEAVSVLLRRRFPAAVQDIWRAVTEPDELARWFSGVTADLRPGGYFKVEGETDGEILECERPHLLRLSWGDEHNVVEVRLAADEACGEAGGAATIVELVHAADPAVADCLRSGPAWDVAFLALERHIRAQPMGDPATWRSSQQVQTFCQHSVSAWAKATEAAGAAGEEQLGAAAAAALRRFAPDLTG
ncbi:hypothetical protein SacmaDRAFT_3166 [Saccharomonospora marina XMU15]|uniref:Activator of Hsp90 ATPase homologue 1/2-like C-terminal domain-containing protein n=1 Tax=Saccharomonospora marina XMU15 TaxID=882083 RepID=H5X8M5_9PSEU|nr:SRPBCC domain-containing protein [Saccharomonospora marina]EHR51394.1 hypothetical protein SacmaDRAFT_3166 [Saccharomonospora marina XMU15]